MQFKQNEKLEILQKLILVDNPTIWRRLESWLQIAGISSEKSTSPYQIIRLNDPRELSDVLKKTAKPNLNKIVGIVPKDMPIQD